MATLTAYLAHNGEELRHITIRTGSESGARRVPAWFARWCLAHESCITLRVDVARGVRGRRIVRRGNRYYTRVSE